MHASSSNARSRKAKGADRACDSCRRRKTRCDGTEKSDNICTNCIERGGPCTYLEDSKPRGPSKAYVTQLEDRVEAVENLLSKLHPDINISDTFGDSIARGSWKSGEWSRRAPIASSSTKEQSVSPTTGEFASPTLGAGPLFFLPPIITEARLSSTGALKGGSFKLHRQAPLSDDEDEDETWGHYPDFYYRSDNAHPGGSVSANPSTALTSTSTLPVPKSRTLTRRSSTPGLGEFSEGTFFGKIESMDRNFDPNTRYYGEGSGSRLLKVVRGWKQEYLDEQARRGGQMMPPPVPTNIKRDYDDEPVTITDGGITIRDAFWKLQPWEASLGDDALLAKSLAEASERHFPPWDLCQSLVQLFFTHMNVQFPLLHRPTFERQFYHEHLHERDTWFSRCCLLVFAVASRWSSDPRVLWGVSMLSNPNQVHTDLPEDLRYDWLGAGWKFFIAAYNIPKARRELLRVGTLFEIQSYSLMGMFLRGTAYSSSAWLAVATGIHRAMDAGIHRRQVYSPKPSVESELWKRAFWILVGFDRTYSPYVGKPSCSNEEDFDLELPLEVDDEYWTNEDPALAFKQPADKPSTVCMFNSWLKLCQILAYCTRTLYCITSSKPLLRLKEPERQEEIVRRLNEACNKWYDSVPAHLRQTVHIENNVFANQSVTLYTSYYSIRLTIMRPLMRHLVSTTAAGPKQGSRAFSLQTLAESTKIAMECIRLNELQVKRGLSNISLLITTSQINGSILLLYVWALKTQLPPAQSGDIPADLRVLSESISKDQALSEAKKCVRMLERVQKNWLVANRHLEILRESWPKDEDSPFPPNPPQHHRSHPGLSQVSSVPGSEQAPQQAWAASRPSAGRRYGHRVDTSGAQGVYPSSFESQAPFQLPILRGPATTHHQHYPSTSLHSKQSYSPHRHPRLTARASMPNVAEAASMQYHHPAEYNHLTSNYQHDFVPPGQPSTSADAYQHQHTYRTEPTHTSAPYYPTQYPTRSHIPPSDLPASAMMEHSNHAWNLARKDEYTDHGPPLAGPLEWISPVQQHSGQQQWAQEFLGQPHASDINRHYNARDDPYTQYPISR